MYLSLASVERCPRCGRTQFRFRSQSSSELPICKVCLDTLKVRRIVRCMQQRGGPHPVKIRVSNAIIMLVLECFPSYLHKHRMTYGMLFLDGGLPYDIRSSPWTVAYDSAYYYSPFFAIDQESVRVRMAPPLWRSGRSYRPGHNNESLTTQCVRNYRPMGIEYRPSSVESLTAHVLSFLSPGATLAAQMRRCACRGAQFLRSVEGWCVQCILRRALD